MPKTTLHPPAAVRRALVNLGADISAARRRRRLPLEVLAERALTTRQTISRIEQGDARVAMGTWATVLFVLGLAERLGDLAAPAHDQLGLTLDEERLPARVRMASTPFLRGEMPQMKRGKQEMPKDGNTRDER